MGIRKLVKAAVIIGASVAVIKFVKNSDAFKRVVEKAKEAAGL